MTTPVISISELSRRSGVSPHTLRYYEKAAVLAPVARDHASPVSSHTSSHGPIDVTCRI